MPLRRVRISTPVSACAASEASADSEGERGSEALMLMTQAEARVARMVVVADTRSPGATLGTAWGGR